MNKKPSEIYTAFITVPNYTLFAVQFFFHNDPKVKQNIHLYLSEWSKLKPYTKGPDLKKLGINPGPIYKTIYRQLISAWVDGEIISKEEETDLLQSIIKNIPQNH